MSPTIVLGEDGGVVAVAGGSGGPRIITGTLQVLLHALVGGMDAGEAVIAPRLHHQWSPDVVRLESAMRASRDAAFWEGLESRGHTLGTVESVGVVQLIVRDDDGIHAACDPRKGGSPAGH